MPLPDISVAAKASNAVLEKAQDALSDVQDRLNRDASGKIYKWWDAEANRVLFDQPDPAGENQEVKIVPSLSRCRSHSRLSRSLQPPQ